MHTNGHWKVYENKANQLFVVTDGTGGLQNQDCKASYIDTKSNARLIAASPDLLEACKFAWTLLTSQANKNIGMNDSWWRDASKLRINSLEQAISKAEKGE